jgi:hypothetical protein
MKRMTAALSVAAAVVLSASLYAQAKPNFSGKWVADAEKTAAAMPAGAAAGGGGRGGGRGGGGTGPMTITMDAATLKIETTGGDGTVTARTYKLDGTESSNPGRGGNMQVSTVKVDGAKVAITTQGQNGPTTQTWYMEGDWLVREQTFNEMVIKTYFKKG